MRAGLIDGASLLISALCVHLALRFANLRLPGDKHWQDKTWTEFFATLFGVYHPSITPEHRRKALAIAIPVFLISILISYVVLTTIF